MEIALVNKIFKILPLNLWFLKFLNLLNSTKGNWFSDKIYWYGIWNSIRNWQERFKLTLALALLVMLSLALHCFSLVLLFSLMLLFEQWMDEWMNEWRTNFHQLLLSICSPPHFRWLIRFVRFVFIIWSSFFLTLHELLVTRSWYVLWINVLDFIYFIIKPNRFIYSNNEITRTSGTKNSIRQKSHEA